MFRAVPGSGPLISWLWFACDTLSEIALCDIARCDIMYLCDIDLYIAIYIAYPLLAVPITSGRRTDLGVHVDTVVTKDL